MDRRRLKSRTLLRPSGSQQSTASDSSDIRLSNYSTLARRTRVSNSSLLKNDGKSIPEQRDGGQSKEKSPERDGSIRKRKRVESVVDEDALRSQAEASPSKRLGPRSAATPKESQQVTKETTGEKSGLGSAGLPEARRFERESRSQRSIPGPSGSSKKLQESDKGGGNKGLGLRSTATPRESQHVNKETTGERSVFGSAGSSEARQLERESRSQRSIPGPSGSSEKRHVNDKGGGNKGLGLRLSDSPLKSQLSIKESTSKRLVGESTESRRIEKEHADTSSRARRSKNVMALGSERTRSKFCAFLEDCGVLLATDGPHKLETDVPSVNAKMKEALLLGRYEKEELIRSMEEYIQDEKNLQSVLASIEIPNSYDTFNEINNLSIVRILLQLAELQTDVCNCLLHKLSDAVLFADSMENVPWARTVLQQFRFLDTVFDAESLNGNLEQLLESCPPWFQTEVILTLPDIVTETHHHSIAECLSKLLEENPEMTSSILNCVSSLTLGPDCLEGYRDNALSSLKRNLKPDLVPVIVKFLLNDCTSQETYRKILTTLRTVDMQPLVGEDPNECFKNQSLTVGKLRMSLLASKDMVQASLDIVKGVTKDPRPLDLILLLLIFSTGPQRRKSVETIVKHFVRVGLYRPSLLFVFYKDYKEVARSLQTPALQLASGLLKLEERVFVDFATEWFCVLFLSQEHALHKQREILERLMLLIGSNNQSAKNALGVLCRMASKQEERHCLQTHSNHLRILLEKMDNLDLEEVGVLADLLHGLCANSDAASEYLRNDLFILMQKQLANTKPFTKCKGALSAVMAIKHLAGRDDTSDAAYKLFEKVLAAVRNCPRSQALFYDQLAQVIAQTERINTGFVDEVAVYLKNEFIDAHMTPESEYRGELVPRYDLNKQEGEVCSLSFEGKKYGAIVPITFKVLKTCFARLNNEGSLEDVDALLGCPVLMPVNFDIPEPAVLDVTICCINWFREVISGFVTQTSPLLRRQVLSRLDDLMSLETELNAMLAACDVKYQPPPCYFHYFPMPAFVRADKKTPKKKKTKETKKKVEVSPEKSASTGRDSTDETTLCARNPAYFRKLDAKIVHLLDIKMEPQAMQCTSQLTISVTQVCFIVKEVLCMFESEPSESLVRDLVHLLPKVCGKLRDVVDSLRLEDTGGDREAARLLLRLLTTIFNWKGFQSAAHNLMLRDALRTLAGMLNETNAMLRSCKELVAECCKYVESLCDVATRISLATALIATCQSLMKHSDSYVQGNKEKHAKLAFGFLSIDWVDDKHSGPAYKNAIGGLLNNWIDNEPSPLCTVATLLSWLPDEVDKMKRPQDALERIPSINRNIFPLLYKKIFDGIVRGVKISLASVDSDSRRIEIWQQVGTCVERTTRICKSMKTKANILICLRFMPVVLKTFLSTGMPVLELNLKYQMDDVVGTLIMMRESTRFLHTICCDCKEKGDVTLTKYVPAAKAVHERLVYSVKGMLALNNSTTAFWMGNLKNKNLDGLEILSQSSENTTLPETGTDEVTNGSSEVLMNDSEDEPSEEYDDGRPDDDDNDNDNDDDDDDENDDDS